MSEDARAGRPVLMVAFHFPPFSGSSGALRTLAFVRYLPEFGWRPSVLTATPLAYESCSASTLSLVREGTRVRRALALDVRRHLSLGGRYLQALAVPDRWVSWLPAALIRGVGAVLRDRAEAVWSTYPLATTHLVGCAVAGIARRPWVADFRDPMVERNPRDGTVAPADPAVRRARLYIEGLTARHAARIVFCTQGARDIFVQRHGDEVAARCVIIENGYDEENFAAAEALPSSVQAGRLPFTVLHSGVVYPTPDRDPSQLFEALSRLRAAGDIGPGDLQFVLRATANDDAIRERIVRWKVEDLVQLAPSLPYLQALREMMDVDALLVLQGYTSDPAVPAKLYEYLRAGRPLLALVSPTGETARVVRRAGSGHIADIESVAEIETAVTALLAALRTHTNGRRDRRDTAFSRRERARELGGLLDGL